MRLFTDFAHHATGSSPTGWSTPWDSLSATVITDPRAMGGQVLRVAPNDSQTSRLLIWDEADDAGNTYADQEVAMKWRGDTTAVNPRIVFYASGDASSRTGYWGGRAQGNSQHWIAAYVDGSPVNTVGSEYGTVDPDPDEWWITRIRLNNEMIMIRSWPAADAEPSSWDITRPADNGIPIGGSIGFMDFSSGVNTDLDWFSVAFDGQSAYTPPATAYESSGSVTSIDAEESFLQRVAGDTSATLNLAGYSDQDRPIHLGQIGNAEGTTLVLMTLVHANEPAGREACLAMFRDLAYSTRPEIVDYLSQHRVVLLTPQNPDGLANGTRNTSQGDINKDHLTFNTSPARVIQNTLRDLDPHIVLDAHERLQSMSTDLEYFPTGTLAVHEDLRDASEDALTAITSGLHSQGYTTMRYPVPGRVSGREAAAFHHAIGLLYETDSNIGMDRRVEVYRAALWQLLDWHESNAERLRAAKRQSKRDAIRNASSPYVLQTGDLASDGNWPSLELPENLEGYMVTGEMPAEVMEAYGLRSFDGFVPMRQAARAAVPLLFDYASENALADAERVVEPFTEYTGDYFDGDHADWSWEGAAHESTSYRPERPAGFRPIDEPAVETASEAYSRWFIRPPHDAVKSGTLVIYDDESQETTRQPIHFRQAVIPPSEQDRYVRVMVTDEEHYTGPIIDGHSAYQGIIITWLGDEDNSISSASLEWKALLEEYFEQYAVPVGHPVEPDTAITDYIPPLNQEVPYRAEALTELGASQVSEIFLIETSPTRGWIHLNAGPGFSEHIRLRYNPTFDRAPERARATHHLVGRTEEVEVAGEARTTTGSIKTSVVTLPGQYRPGEEQAMPQEVEAFSDFPVPVCIRAPNVVAEREFVSLGTPTISHDHASAEITIPWRKVGYDEQQPL